MELNEKLKLLRNKKELSLRDLERKSGVGFAVICNLEKGISKNPQIANISRLSAALDISLDDLIEGTQFDFKK